MSTDEKVSENSRQSSLDQNNANTNAPKQILNPDQILGIIGGGEMARSIFFPLFRIGILDPSKVSVSGGTSLSRLQPWANFGCKTVLSNAQILRAANVVIWAVKPQIFRQVVLGAGEELGNESISQNILHISVLAGVTLEELCLTLKTLNGSGGVRVSRVMPNIGLRVKAGCAVYSMSLSCIKSDNDFVSSIFSSTGLCFEVQEPQINAFTALFGCGIAFMFPVLEAMSDGAVKMGIPRDVSLRIAAQTMKGAAELVLQENAHPALLKDAVCSSGGSTIAGIAALEKGGVRSTFIGAIEASTARGFELGRLNQTKKD